MAPTNTGTSNLPFIMNPVVGADHTPAAATASTEAYKISPPISVPAAASETPGNPESDIRHVHMSTNTYSLFQGAQNVTYLRQPRITVADNNVFTTDGNKRPLPQIFDALREKLVPRAHFAEYDAASPAPRNACTENTRKEILETLKVWALSGDTTTKVYWLNGMAGTGKTTIAYSLGEMLDENGCLGGTFFSSHLRVDTSDVRCIIPTISLQLAQYFPSLSPLILDVVEVNPHCSSWGIGKQFLNFIIRPLAAAYRDISKAVVIPVIVLDALDECSDWSLVAELLSVISKYSKSLPVKFFITSRPETVLKENLNRSWDHSSFILHEVEKEIVKADIELYIKTCLLGGQIRYSMHSWPPQAEVEKLVNMSGTLFIYAATICKYIARRGSSGMPQRLSNVVNNSLETSELTQPLDALYERILGAAYALANIKEALDIKRVLMAVMYAYNPLSIAAISALMQMPIEYTEAALSSLHSLIYVPSEDPNIPISIFHASFHDFITNQILSSKYYLDPCISHKHLAIQCLLLMEAEWSQKESVPYLAERKCEDISESLAYACGNWAFHLAHAKNNSDSTELKDFFETCLLRWMDCLSILGKLEIAMHSLHLLCKLKNWANKFLGPTVIDAERFLKENFNFIKNNSLEGYPSALVWLPEQSNIWQTYGGKTDCPWKLCLGRRKTWDQFENVLRHSDGVNSAVFSPDGMHILSASRDHTAQIWNTTTGECESVLEGHSSWVNSAVFSQDSMHIVSACEDHTVCIWNTSTGKCEAELKGHLYWVNSAIFSPHGKHVVSASADHTARIWNTATGECKAELKGHANEVNSAVFSPDNMHIISASSDHTARIWNTATGECEAELKGHSAGVNSAAFSPDGIHIVTASSDYTARVWNAVTGECESQLKRHSNRVNSAVFSPDGMHIVSASEDSSACIWDSTTRECKAELKGHSSTVKYAGFSPDSSYIVSASCDHTARIWNTTTGECKAELKGHSHWVNSAVFSPDGIHIVSASEDHTVRVWNIAIEQCEAEQRGHSSNVNSAAFSPDGMHLVSASSDHTAHIWNTVTGECEAQLKGHSNRVNSAVFSPDGMHIVSASSDHTARIWNAATEVCELKLGWHSAGVNSAVFSPDGKHIVSTSNDHITWIWNATTGECEAELRGDSLFVNAIFASYGMPTQAVPQTRNMRSLPSSSDNSQLPLESLLVPGDVFIYNDFDGPINAPSKSYSLDIHEDTIFHTTNFEKIWIPLLFQKPSFITHHSSKICLGYPSGEILVLEFQY